MKNELNSILKADIAKKENIWNAANLLTFSRIIIAFITIYLIFAGFNIVYIVIAFIIGMLTDFFDGNVARWFNLKTEFGRKLDMVADRVFMVGVIFSFIIKFSIVGLLGKNYLFQLFVTLTRDIINAPVVLVAILMNGAFPRVRQIGKITTLMQSITFPMIALDVFYKSFPVSFYFAVITGVLGLMSAICYFNDMKHIPHK